MRPYHAIIRATVSSGIKNRLRSKSSSWWSVATDDGWSSGSEITQCITVLGTTPYLVRGSLSFLSSCPAYTNLTLRPVFNSLLKANL